MRTKADLRRGDGAAGVLPISAATGEGMDDLVARIAARAADLAGGEPALLVRARQVAGVRAALGHLDRALLWGGQGASEEILAEELRLAARALDSVVGRVDVEDVLDALFRTFCIGK